MKSELLGAEGWNSQLSCAGSGFVLFPSPGYVVKAHCICATGAGQTGLLTTLASLASHLGAVMVRVGVSQRRPFIIAENKMSHVASQGYLYRTAELCVFSESALSEATCDHLPSSHCVPLWQVHLSLKAFPFWLQASEPSWLLLWSPSLLSPLTPCSAA